jgi:hypothetical protein
VKRKRGWVGTKRMAHFFASLGVAIVLGLVLAYFAVPDRSPTHESDQKKDGVLPWFFPGVSRESDETE